ncbi:MAG: Asp-tRNA(Asn)/Glu-tRNA(Gln) amidotransferase subunit GatC [bacterium]|nr:Asp-tRNA(Asn)/Glu-tRNA(Gln) amidotransferase subunit GatC [bacterium]
MKFDEQEISRVATLARLELTDEEKNEFSRQLSDIISYVEKIGELDTKNVEPADHIVDLKNVFRADEPGVSTGGEAIEKIAPEFEDGHIVVPKVIDS